MYKIVICIPTYKRPEMFQKLVLSISQIEINRALVDDLNILVIDNDVAKSAEATALELREGLKPPFSMDYQSFPAKGLANVRNEILRLSKKKNADYLAFVDDDEYVSKEWLNELLKSMIQNNADVIMGPVVYVLQPGISRYISYWFRKSEYADNQQLYYFRTGNLLINAKSIFERDIFFDPRFNATGGEDAYFGLQLINQGVTIYWSERAVVFETVPEKRARLSWLMKRKFNGAFTYTRILKMERDYTGLCRKFLVNMLYLLGGMVTLALVLLPIQKKYWGIFKISESLGGFAGLLNIPLQAYA